MVRPALVATVVLLGTGFGSAAEEASRDQLFKFGVEMARKGNWREAEFRWLKALAVAPGDSKILNNLGAASEALGKSDEALARYDEALRSAPRDSVLLDNRSRLVQFRARTAKAAETGADSSASSDPPPPAETKKQGKTVRVMIRLPVPARLDLTHVKRVLVAGFVTTDADRLDTNREVVRFLRSELRKRTRLEVLDVNPPPPVPEQTIDDLAGNSGFFRFLAKEHDADLIITGSVTFSQRDASGFQEVDVISPITGQKVRETRFVELERFQYDAVVLFVDGPTGALLLRDRLKRSVEYTGLSNDPVTAFFDLAGATAGDFLASVAPGSREEQRLLYKK